MCRPDYFAVSSRINPWMVPEHPADRDHAVAQWEGLRSTYLNLGVNVELIDPLPEMDDMVFAANGGFVLDGLAYGAKFKVAERAAEGPAYLERLAELGYEPITPHAVNEGEGDLLCVGDVILGGYGFRTSRQAHREVATAFDREVVSLRLVNPHFYHLDTALTVLPDDNIAYWPGAFDTEALTQLRRRFPNAIEVTETTAGVLGLNSFRVGNKMVIATAATEFADQLAAAGHQYLQVDLSELLLAGGGIKCATLELRP